MIRLISLLMLQKFAIISNAYTIQSGTSTGWGKLSHFTIQLKFRFVVYVRMLLSFVSNQVL